MRVLPNEFLDQIELQPNAIAPMPPVGWGVFLLALPLLLAYWLVLGLFMTGQALVSVLK